MLRIRQVPVSKLQPYEGNARLHSGEQIEQIRASIEEFGFTNPLLIDESNNIIAGHGRLEAAKLIGMKAVPCIPLADLSETQKRALVIADNQLALNASWDDERLAEELRALAAVDFELPILGFDDINFEAELLPGMPELPEGEKNPFGQMTFIFSDDQRKVVERAIAIAKKAGAAEGSDGLNQKGYCLAHICTAFLHGQKTKR